MIIIYVHLTEVHIKMSAKDAIKKFNVQLLKQLPLDDDMFFAMAKQADLFPLDTGDSIAAKPTRAKKVSYFLQHVAEPGAEEYLPKLLKVMKESKVANVVKLADDIKAAKRIGRHTHSMYQKYVYGYITNREIRYLLL